MKIEVINLLQKNQTTVKKIKERKYATKSNQEQYIKKQKQKEISISSKTRDTSINKWPYKQYQVGKKKKKPMNETEE